MQEGAWASLVEALASCHAKHDAPTRANETTLSWVDALGPCGLDRTGIDQVYARIGETGQRMAFDELPTEGEVRRRWTRAHKRWEGRRRAVREAFQTVGTA